jgi:hypothetical protein
VESGPEVRIAVRGKWLAIVGLPFGWLAAVVIACMTRAPEALVFYGAVGGALVCYVVFLRFYGVRESSAGPEGRRGALRVGAGRVAGAFIVFVGSALLTMVSLADTYILSHPLLVTRFDPVGSSAGVSSNCELYKVAVARNHHGEIAVLQNAICRGAFSQGEELYLVFVHPAAEANSRQTLAFQYSLGNDSGGPPRLTWTSDSSLKITTKGQLVDIMQQRSSVDGFGITYAFENGSVGLREPDMGTK